MRAERARASFASENLAEYLNGGKAILERRHGLASKVLWLDFGKGGGHCSLHRQRRYFCRSRLVAQLEKTTWGDKSQRYFLTREQEYVEGLKAAMGIW